MRVTIMFDTNVAEEIKAALRVLQRYQATDTPEKQAEGQPADRKDIDTASEPTSGTMSNGMPYRGRNYSPNRPPRIQGEGRRGGVSPRPIASAMLKIMSEVDEPVRPIGLARELYDLGYLQDSPDPRDAVSHALQKARNQGVVEHLGPGRWVLTAAGKRWIELGMPWETPIRQLMNQDLERGGGNSDTPLK